MDALLEVRRDVAKLVGASGMCYTDERVVEGINDARRILYPLGDWKNTSDALCVIPCCGVISLPTQYEYAKKAYRCNGNIAVNNGWYEVINGCNEYCGGFIGTLQRIPGSYVTINDWPIIRKNLDVNCPQSGFYIKLIWENSLDVGKEITFTGQGVTNREVSLTRICESGWTPSLAGPGEERLLKIMGVVKPVTKGRVRVYGYDGANEFLLAVYDKGDINPDYKRYKTARTSNCAVYLEAKKKFQKLTMDTQLVDLHTEAIIHALQAIASREAKDIAMFNANLGLAISFLNAELRGPASTKTTPLKWTARGRADSLIC